MRHFRSPQAPNKILCLGFLALLAVSCDSPKQHRVQTALPSGLVEPGSVEIEEDLVEENIPMPIRKFSSVRIEKISRALLFSDEITLRFTATNTWNGATLSIRAGFPKTANSKPRASLFLREGQGGVYYSLSPGSPYCLHLAESLCVPEYPYEPGLPERVDYLRTLLRGRYSYKDVEPWFR